MQAQRLLLTQHTARAESLRDVQSFTHRLKGRLIEDRSLRDSQEKKCNFSDEITKLRVYTGTESSGKSRALLQFYTAYYVGPILGRTTSGYISFAC